MERSGWIERAQVLLGTLVAIGVRGLDDAAAHAAITRAFTAVADVHRLMSFHDTASDVSRLNREAFAAPVRIDLRTAEVIAFALQLSADSDGAFDITVAPRLVAQGLLPVPEEAPAADERATWRDIEFVAPDLVRFRRRAWIDLGGIAKGFAVDAAMACLTADDDLTADADADADTSAAAARPAAHALVQRRVNAGGDLRVSGPDAERVLLKVPGLAGDELPMIEIADGSVASSATTPALARQRGAAEAGIEAIAASPSPHIDGRSGGAVAAGLFVSVIAERCIVADALTKVVLALRDAAGPILVRHGATAHCHSLAGGWRVLGAG